MTDLPAPEGQPKTLRTDAPGAKSKAALGRRGFVLAGAPFIMTLANRPALATPPGGGICTFSILASMNLSQPLEAGVNCGVSPGCWRNKAYNTDNDWMNGLPNPGDIISSIISPPDAGQVGKWKWNNPSATIHSCVGNSPPLLQFRQTASTTLTMSGNGVIRELVAGYLNIMAFNNGASLPNGDPMWGHYPVSLAQFNAAKSACFATTPGSGGAVNTAVENFRNAVYQVGEGDHYCDEAF